MIKLGTNNIGKVYLGSNSIGKAYLGTNLVFQKGGTILKTARSKEFMTPEGREKAFANIQKFGVDALIVIGGNGSLSGAQDFAREYDIPVIGLPGTIDNDLYGTDTTIGYDTALNTIVECVDKIRDTANSHDRIFFIDFYFASF